MAIAVGIPDALYWDMTPDEFEAVLKEVTFNNRQANLRAGLIAATIVNMSPHRRRRRAVQPSDFLAKPRMHMTPEEGQKAMRRWATQHNARHAAPTKEKEEEPTP